MRPKFTGKTYDGPSGAAAQYADTLINLVTQPEPRYRVEYWRTKLRLLKTTHQIPEQFNVALLDGAAKRAVEKLIDGLVDDDFKGETRMTPTLLVRMALSAATRTPKPTEGVLAINGSWTEVSAWQQEMKKVEHAVAAYRVATHRLLAGLLTASVPQLEGDEVPLENLIARGLPSREPGPEWEDW